MAGNHKNTWINTGESLQKHIPFTEQTLSNEVNLYSSLSDSKNDHIQKKTHSYKCGVHRACAQPSQKPDEIYMTS